MPKNLPSFEVQALIKTVVDAIKTVVDAIKTTTDATKVKVDTIDTRTTTINTNVSTINTNVDSVKTVVDATKTKVDTIDVTLTSTKNVVDSSKTILDTVSTNIGTPTTAASATTSANAHAKLNFLLSKQPVGNLMKVGTHLGRLYISSTTEIYLSSNIAQNYTNILATVSGKGRILGYSAVGSFIAKISIDDTVGLDISNTGTSNGFFFPVPIPFNSKFTLSAGSAQSADKYVVYYEIY